MRRELVRYLVCGVCTTGVNIGLFTLLRKTTTWDMQVANSISILAAILFAYVVNRRFVFQSEHRTKEEVWKEFASFVGMRAISMVVELVGMQLLTVALSFPEIFGKVILQVVVIGSNYIFSKCYIFRKQEE